MQDETVADQERLIRRFCAFTNEYPWQWTAGQVDEWSAYLTGERHLAPSTIRAYQGDVRLFTEFLLRRARQINPPQPALQPLKPLPFESRIMHQTGSSRNR